MSLIEQVEFPGPTTTMFERHPKPEDLAAALTEVTIKAWQRRYPRLRSPIQEDPAETAMAGPAPEFLFGRLPVEELPPMKAPLLNCPSCALTAIGLIGAVVCMVMLPSWPWTLLTFTVGWLLALACVLFQLLGISRRDVDSGPLAS